MRADLERKNSMGASSMPALPDPIDAANMSDIHSHKKDAGRMPMLPLQPLKDCTVRVEGRDGDGCLEMASCGQTCSQPIEHK